MMMPAKLIHYWLTNCALNCMEMSFFEQPRGVLKYLSVNDKLFPFKLFRAGSVQELVNRVTDVHSLQP